MARAAVLGRLTWQEGTVAEIRQETATARTIAIDVPGWPGRAAGQHVDVRLTAEDGYTAQRSYSIASPPGRDRLELTVQAGDGLEVSYVYTRSAPPGARVRVGRLNPVVLAAPGWTRETAPAEFICGPTGFVEAAASLLVKAGHDASVIKTERFGPSGGQP